MVKTDHLDFMLEWLKSHKGRLRSDYGVVQIGLFGSWVTGTQRPDSDVDVLVTFESPSFDHYMDLKFLLEEVFGRRVDLVMEGALKPRLRKHILDEVRYAA
ncbi:MAG TPA: nucleotidyltransferase family protein [Kiritimatiellia bacterium]|nr:nucleotidyltransferase family protein [Kiritimatiellia bacterium]